MIDARISEHNFLVFERISLGVGGGVGVGVGMGGGVGVGVGGEVGGGGGGGRLFRKMSTLPQGNVSNLTIPYQEF